MIRRVFALLLAAAILLTGCAGSETVPVPTFDEDTVFIVGDRKVNLATWYLYALPQYDEISRLYGNEIWDYVVDDEGKTMKNAVKEDIRSQIVYTLIVCSKAQELGITLTEEEYIDINMNTGDYMEKLTPEMISEYGITQEDVRTICSDNKLALKVYEYLTLNVDTSTDERDVRNMVLEYIPILKYTEDENGEEVLLDDDEIMRRGAQAEEFLKRVREDPEITTLDEANDEEFVPISVTADYSTLVEKLSEKIADIAFSMKEGEISGLYDSPDALFILDCVERENEAATNAAKIRIIEERQRKFFAEKYSKWSEETVVRDNEKVWETL